MLNTLNDCIIFVKLIVKLTEKILNIKFILYNFSRLTRLDLIDIEHAVPWFQFHCT